MQMCPIGVTVHMSDCTDIVGCKKGDCEDGLGDVRG